MGISLLSCESASIILILKFIPLRKLKIVCAERHLRYFLCQNSPDVTFFRVCNYIFKSKRTICGLEIFIKIAEVMFPEPLCIDTQEGRIIVNGACIISLNLYGCAIVTQNPLSFIEPGDDILLWRLVQGIDLEGSFIFPKPIISVWSAIIKLSDIICFVIWFVAAVIYKIILLKPQYRSLIARNILTFQVGKRIFVPDLSGKYYGIGDSRDRNTGY